jgi:hypothetical protein
MPPANSAASGGKCAFCQIHAVFSNKFHGQLQGKVACGALKTVDKLFCKCEFQRAKNNESILEEKHAGKPV